MHIHCNIRFKSTQSLSCFKMWKCFTSMNLVWIYIQQLPGKDMTLMLNVFVSIHLDICRLTFMKMQVQGEIHRIAITITIGVQMVFKNYFVVYHQSYPQIRFDLAIWKVHVESVNSWIWSSENNKIKKYMYYLYIIIYL